MFRSEQDSNLDLCDTCTVDTVIYLPVELYQPNWRRVIVRVHDNPLKMDNICEVFHRFGGIQHSAPPVDLSGQLEADHCVSSW